MKAAISIRGSSSASYPKKPYRLELQDEKGDDLKVSLLGLPKESDWILFPAYSDKTMTRDVLAFELWRRMGYWAPRTRYVELYLSRSTGNAQDSASNVQLLTNDYQGVYILMEKIKRGKERLNIARLTRGDNSEPNITGGYIFKRDRTNSPGDRVLHSSKKLQFIWEEPKGREVTPEQEQFLTNYINEFESVLYGDSFSDPESGYRKYIDIDSFVDYHWMQELGKNPDGYWTSEFYHKDRGGKIKAGPIWDFDLCFGNTRMNEAYRTDEWRWQRSGGPNYKWYRRLFQDPDFLQRYIDRWSELRTNVLTTSNVLALVDGFAAQLQEAQKRNFERWPILGKRVGPSWFVGQTYAEEVNWLKEWLKGRLDWIDSQDFPKPAMVVDGSSTGGNGGNGGGHESESPKSQAPSSKEAPGSKDQAVVGRVGSYNSPLREEVGKGTFNVQRSIRMACLVGKIYYTTDGTDPRVSGGAVSPKAIEYKEAIPVTPGLRLFARVRSDYGLWSAPVTFGE